MSIVRRTLISVTLAISVSACLLRADYPDQNLASVDMDIVSTRVSLALAPGASTFDAEQTLIFVANSSGVAIEIESDALHALSGQINGRDVTIIPRTAEYKTRLVAEEPFVDGEMYSLLLTYEANPERRFINSDTFAASAYFACDWMLCQQENFVDRFSLELELIVPNGLETTGPGHYVSSSVEPDGKNVRHLWRTVAAHPAYVHAFAVGSLQRAEMASPCNPQLFLLAPIVSSELEEAFSPTCEMLLFFEQKAGVPFPHNSYTQIYVPESRVAQEAISHSLIGATFLDPILADPSEDWVIAHELAHQWWGNKVSASNLSEFWLNEGMVTFMVAAWKEEKWGQAAYDREIEINRNRWQRRVAESGDPALSFDGPYESLGARFSIQYSKGAVFLHELRNFMGDEAFWAGLAEFTREGFNKAVMSEDFEKAMQAQSATSLRPLFDQWVYAE